jgi:hypothetical protein
MNNIQVRVCDDGICYQTCAQVGERGHGTTPHINLKQAWLKDRHTCRGRRPDINVGGSAVKYLVLCATGK